MKQSIYLCDFKINLIEKKKVKPFGIENIVSKGNTLADIKNNAFPRIKRELLKLTSIQKKGTIEITQLSITRFLGRSVS